MGVERLAVWLMARGFLAGMSNKRPGKVSTFAIDMNALVYNSLEELMETARPKNPRPSKAELVTYEKWVKSKRENPEGFIRSLCERVILNIRRLIDEVNSSFNLEQTFLAIDGIAPFAKNQQQRTRRYKSAKHPNDVFDTNAITPGTDFMKRLDQEIRRWLEDSHSTLPCQIIYSSHMVPGEGEQKIFEAYRDGILHGDGYHIIHGLDADFFMLSLRSGLPRLVLMKERTGKDRLSYQRESGQDIEYVDIDTLKENLLNIFKIPTIIDDFVILMFMIGNDFLPSMISTVDLKAIDTRKLKTDPSVRVNIDFILAIYRNKVYGEKKLTLTNPQTREINFLGLRTLFQELAKIENKFLEKLYLDFPNEKVFDALRGTLMTSQASASAAGNKQPGPSGQQPGMIFEPETFRILYYYDNFHARGKPAVIKALVARMPQLQEVLYPTGDNLGSKIGDAVVNYLTGFYWTYQYYTYGMSGVNFGWSYPFRNPPLMKDIVDVLNRYETTPDFLNYLPFDGMISYGIFEQLLSVIPSKSKAILPVEIQGFYDITSPIYDFFPEDYTEVDTFMKFHEWKYQPILPPIDPGTIVAAVAALNATLPLVRKKEFQLKTGKDRNLFYGNVPIASQKRSGIISRQDLLSGGAVAAPGPSPAAGSTKGTFGITYTSEAILTDILTPMQLASGQGSAIKQTEKTSDITTIRLDRIPRVNQRELPSLIPQISQSSTATHQAARERH